MAEMLRQLAGKLGMDPSELGPSLLINMLANSQTDLMRQMAAAAICNWALDNPGAKAELVAAGAVPPLVELLSAGPEAQVTATATQALLALCSDGLEAQNRIISSGGLQALLSLLGGRGALTTGPGLTDLVTGVLAYLSVGNSANAAAFVRADGVEVLLSLLNGSDARPAVAEVVCSVLYNLSRTCPEAVSRIRTNGGCNLLVGLAQGVMGSDVALSALQALLLLSADDEDSQDAIREVGGVRAVLQVAAAPSQGPEVVEIAACVVWNLVLDNTANQQAFKEAGGVQYLVELLWRSTLGVKTIVAGILGDLADSSSGARDSIREAGGVNALVEVLKEVPGGDAGEACSRALANLAVFSPGNQHAIREAGGIFALVAALRDCDELNSGLVEEASRALGNLARNYVNRDVVREASGIHALVGVLWAGPESLSAREAVVSLGNLAYESPPNQAAIAKAGGVRALLSLLAKSSPESLTAEGAACVLACLVSSPEAAKMVFREDGAKVLVSALEVHKGNQVVLEAVLNSLATLATVPGMNDTIREAGGITALSHVLDRSMLADPSVSDCTNGTTRIAEIREVAAIAIGALAVGSPANQKAARDSGALGPLVGMILSAAPSYSFPAEFASPFVSSLRPKPTDKPATTPRRKSLIPSAVKPKKKKAPAPKPSQEETHQALVMEVLVHLMGSGPENMISHVAQDALGSLTKQLGQAKVTSGDDSPVHVDVRCGGDSASSSPQKSPHVLSNSQLNISEWTLPVASEAWEEEEDPSRAVAKPIGINPLHSKQVDALYSTAFATDTPPSPSFEAAVSALAALTSSDDENQVAAWQAGGIHLLESLLGLGSVPRRKSSEDAVRILSNVASSPRNQAGLLESGGTDLLINLLRLGPGKDLSYVVARAVSCLTHKHPATVQRARELGAVEMLVNLLRPSGVPTSLSRIRGLFTALSHICTNSPDSQRIFRKVGGMQLLVHYMSVASSEGKDLASWAAKLITAVCSNSKVNKDAFRALSGYRYLVDLLHKQSPQQGLLWTVEALQAVTEAHEANQIEFSRARGLLGLVVALSRYADVGSLEGSTALSIGLVDLLRVAVLDNKPSLDLAGDLGVVPIMVRLLTAGRDPRLMGRVAEAVKVMSRNHPKNKLIILRSGGTQALLQLLTLNLETELGLVSSAAWAVNNLAHDSPQNVAQILENSGVNLLLRVVKSAAVSSEASIAASRALFILASSEHTVAADLREAGGVEPCTMLLTAGPKAETSLWACSLLGLLADGHKELQDDIVEAGGLELLLSLVKGGPGDDITVAAVRTFALLLVDNAENQKRALAMGSVITLINLVTEQPPAAHKSLLTTAEGLLGTARSKLNTVSSLNTASQLHTQIMSRLTTRTGERPTVAPEDRAALTIELAEMVVIALGNLGSGSLAHRKAVRKAGASKLLEKLMAAQPNSSLFHLSQWALNILSAKAQGAIHTHMVGLPQENPLLTI